MEATFIPVDYDYFDYEGKNYVRMIGRSKSGKRICVIDDYEANFFVIIKNNTSEKEITKLQEKIQKISIEKDSRTTNVLKVTKVSKHFLGKKVTALKIVITNHKDMGAVASEIGESKIIASRRGHDINLITKYVMQGGLLPLQEYEISGDTVAQGEFGGLADSLHIDLCIKLQESNKLKENASTRGSSEDSKTSERYAAQASKDTKKFQPKVLSFDIESEIGDIGSGEIYMIGLYGDNFKKVLTHKTENSKHDYVETYSSEKEMIQAFTKYVKEYDADVICGYFSDGYDMPFLRERAKKYKVKLDLGLDGKQVSFKRGNIPTAKVAGVVHVDIYRFIASAFSQYLSGESLSLNDVAGELVGEMKDDFDFARLSSMKQEDWEDFFAYNLRDVEVTYKLFFAIWPDLSEFTRIIREPLFAISRDTMATHVESFILHSLERFDEIPERRPGPDEIGERRRMGKYEGAFVHEPTPGLYENVVMFDFTSMYGSVIVTYNLSRSTFEGGEEETGFQFSKKQGFFPTLLSEIIDLRKKYKKEYATKKDNMSKARSNGYKLLANAAYGYQAFFGARYHSREAASSTARLAKENIINVIEKIKNAGYEILYSDTDSIAFLQGNKSNKEITSFLEELNESLPGIMELDLEGFYKRGIFVSKRGGGSGAKKKYALLEDNHEMKIRGFETVRRDWCKLARKLQSEVLELVLEGKEKEAEKILRDTVKKVKERTIDLDDLIIKTQLRKSISDYIATGPHVAAAKRMEERGSKITPGMLVLYYVAQATGSKKGKIGDRVRLADEAGKYDIEYYLENQILPAVENIFEVMDVSVSSILEGQTQKGLGDF